MSELLVSPTELSEAYRRLREARGHLRHVTKIRMQVETDVRKAYLQGAYVNSLYTGKNDDEREAKARAGDLEPLYDELDDARIAETDAKFAYQLALDEVGLLRALLRLDELTREGDTQDEND